MRFLALCLALSSTAVFAGDPAASNDQAGKPVASDTVAAPEPVAAASTPERKSVCHREQSVGSSVTHTVCRTEQTDAERAQGLDTLKTDINRVMTTHH